MFSFLPNASYCVDIARNFESLANLFHSVLQLLQLCESSAVCYTDNLIVSWLHARDL